MVYGLGFWLQGSYRPSTLWTPATQDSPAMLLTAPSFGCGFGVVVFGFWCLVLGVWCLLFVVWCLVFVVCCLLFVVVCLLFVVCCLLFVVCCLLFVVCCLLFVVCCWLFGVWCLVMGILGLRGVPPQCHPPPPSPLQQGTPRLHFWEAVRESSRRGPGRP